MTKLELSAGQHVYVKTQIGTVYHGIADVVTDTRVTLTVLDVEHVGQAMRPATNVGTITVPRSTVFQVSGKPAARF